MRRLVFSIIVATGFVMVGSSSASAEDPIPAPTVSAKATPGKKLCKVTDKRLDEISGLVATKTGYAVIDDGTEDTAKEKVFFLDKKCAVVDEQIYGGDPLDTEDMVLSPDGKTLWIADVGDNAVRNQGDKPRKTVAVWKMPADGSKKATIYRMTYPDGDHHDAEALLIDGDGRPLIVTKEIGAKAGVYKPSAPLVAKNAAGVPMTKVAELRVNATETAGNALARIGNKTITGGAVAPGGAKVALRTYTDALEWDVKGGDVVAALKNEPRTTGLPNEPFGESLTYSADGKAFITVSDLNGDTKTANHLREYSPATEIALRSKNSGQNAAGSAWYTDLDNLTYLVGGVGAVGLLLVAAGVFGIVRFRKSPQAAAAAAAAADDLPRGLNTDEPETELIGVGGLPQRGTAAYGRPGGAGGGAGRPGGGAGGAGPVYGAKPGPPPGAPGAQRGGNGVYGGAPAAPAGGGQYGRPGGPASRGPQQGGPRGPQSGAAQSGAAPSGGAPRASKPGGPQQVPPRGPQQGGAPRAPKPGGPQQVPPRGPQHGGAPRAPKQGGPQPGGAPRAPKQGGPQQDGGPRGSQQVPPRGPQQVPPRGPQQGGGPRGPQQVPPRGPQQGAPRGPQPPGRGQQPPPGRGGGGGVYGGRSDDRR